MRVVRLNCHHILQLVFFFTLTFLSFFLFIYNFIFPNKCFDVAYFLLRIIDSDYFTLKIYNNKYPINTVELYINNNNNDLSYYTPLQYIYDINKHSNYIYYYTNDDDNDDNTSISNNNLYNIRICDIFGSCIIENLMKSSTNELNIINGTQNFPDSNL